MHVGPCSVGVVEAIEDMRCSERLSRVSAAVAAAAVVVAAAFVVVVAAAAAVDCGCG